MATQRQLCYYASFFEGSIRAKHDCAKRHKLKINYVAKMLFCTATIPYVLVAKMYFSYILRSKMLDLHQ